jgi:hypothetical protein
MEAHSCKIPSKQLEKAVATAAYSDGWFRGQRDVVHKGKHQDSSYAGRLKQMNRRLVSVCI